MHETSDGYLGGPAVDPLLPRDGWIHVAAEDVDRRAIEHWRQAPRPEAVLERSRYRPRSPGSNPPGCG